MFYPSLRAELNLIIKQSEDKMNEKNKYNKKILYSGMNINFSKFSWNYKVSRVIFEINENYELCCTANYHIHTANTPFKREGKVTEQIHIEIEDLGNPRPIFPTTLKLIVKKKMIGDDPINQYDANLYDGDTKAGEIIWVFFPDENQSILELFRIENEYSIRAIAPVLLEDYMKFLDRNNIKSMITFKFHNGHIIKKVLQQHGYKTTPKENLDFYEQDQGFTKMIRTPKIPI